MCGIAVIVSGVRINVSALSCPNPAHAPQSQSLESFSIGDISEALRRRGPDSLGSKKVRLGFDGDVVWSATEDFENEVDCGNGALLENSVLVNGGAVRTGADMCFIGATLQLRGVNPVRQPMVDSSGNILVYNGEIFGGIDVDSESNDGEVLMGCLGNCFSCCGEVHTQQNCCCDAKQKKSISELLSAIQGPWALAFWQNSSRTLWFGRDAFGRRSLLVHWPSSEDNRLLLSSVGPQSSTAKSSAACDVKDGANNKSFWEELPCGVHSMQFSRSNFDNDIQAEIRRHEWTSPMLMDLIKWDRSSVEPKPADLISSNYELHQQNGGTHFPSPASVPAQRVLCALKEAVIKRTTGSRIFKTAACGVRKEEHVPVAILFSGGLDSMILAALLDECLDPRYEIDLLNVSFDGESAPDRLSARAGLKELEQISPFRRWKLVEIDAELSKLASETTHVVSLIYPAKTYMDLNIGVALWLASGGDGWLFGGTNDPLVRRRYKSEARILLVGSGADEQCAGYGRHRTSFRSKVGLG